MTEQNHDPALEPDVRDLADFVNDEAAAARKSVKTQLIVLAIVSLVLIAYFALANSWVKRVTEPEELAKQGAILLDDNIPSLALTLEGVLKAASPQVADFISKQAVQQGVPFMVKRSEDGLSGYIDSMTAQTATYMEAAFKDVLVDNKESVREAIDAAESEEGEPSMALKPLRDRLHANFVDQTTGQPTPAKQKIDKTLVALKNINRKLKNLSKKDPNDLSRKEQMGSRLLKTYWRYMRSPTDGSYDKRPEAK